MNEQTNGKSLTISGLKQIIIFYTLMFLTSAGVIFFLSIGNSLQYASFFLVGSIVILLALLGIYLGIRKIYKGNKEFGADHEKSTLTAKRLVFWGIILFFIAGFVLLPLIGVNNYLNALVRTIILIPFWLALIYLIKEISSNRVKKLLWLAFFSRAILYYSIYLYALEGIGEDIQVNAYWINFLAIIPSLVFIYCYYVTYSDIKNSVTAS